MLDTILYVFYRFWNKIKDDYIIQWLVLIIR